MTECVLTFTFVNRNIYLITCIIFSSRKCFNSSGPKTDFDFTTTSTLRVIDHASTACSESGKGTCERAQEKVRAYLYVVSHDHDGYRSKKSMG